jgi:hypothetical protein
MEKRWFKARRFGWGWTPCSFEGWLVTVISVIALIGGDLFAIATPKTEPERNTVVILVLGWNVIVIGLTALETMNAGQPLGGSGFLINTRS